MNQTTRPPINLLETQYEIDGQLTEMGYSSIFDVARRTRQQFVRKLRGKLESKAAGALYDQAIGYAQQVAFAFRQRRLTHAVRQTLAGPFSVPGPSYDKQFSTDWNQMSPVDAIEANTSPAAYLVSLYDLALRQEKNAPDPGKIHPLAKRRPDISELIVDSQSVNQPLPELTLVNDILSSAIKSALPVGETTDATLAATYYPNRLPYHFAYQQTTDGLAVANTSLTDVMQQADTVWPYFIGPVAPTDTPARMNAMRLASPLSPPLQALVEEPPYFSTHILTLAQLTTGWSSANYSTTEITPWQNLNAHAYIVPPQVTATHGPTKLIWENDQYIATKVTLQAISPDLDHYTLIVEEGNWEYYSQGINNAIDTEGAPYRRFPSLEYRPEDNKKPEDKSGLDLKKTPLRVDFFIRMQEWHSKRNYTDISFTLILDDNNPRAIYTTDQAKFYQNNFGVRSALTGGDYRSYFSTVTHLTERIGLTVPDLEKLLCTQVGGDTVVVSPHIVIRNTIFTTKSSHTDQTPHMPYHYGAVYLHAGKKPAIAMHADGNGQLTLTELTDDRLDRLNRLVRVQRVLGLPFDQLDYLITAGMRAEGSEKDKADGNLALTMNANTTRLLGVFSHYRQRYGATAKQFAAVVHQITPYAITPNVPFLDRLFNSKTLFDEPYTLDWDDVDYTATAATSGKRRHARIVKQLAAGLQVTDAEFALLAGLVAQYQPGTARNTFPNSLDAVSALYRLATLPRWLGLSIASGLALIRLLDNSEVLGSDDFLMAQLAGGPTLAGLDNNGKPKTNDLLDGLMLLSMAADWLHAENLSVAQCAAWLLPLPPQTGNQQQLDFIHQLSQGVARSRVTSATYVHAGVPTVDINKKPLDWVVLMTSLVDDQDGLVKDNEDTAFLPTITEAVQKIVSEHNVVRKITLAAYIESGAPAKDNKDHTLDWVVQMTPLVDGSNGLVKDNEYTASPEKIAKAVTKIVNNLDLTSGEKQQAIQALSSLIDTAQRSQKPVIQALSTLIDTAQQSQRGILASTLAPLLTVPQALALPLVQWAGSTSYDFLVQTRAQQSVVSPQQIPNTYLTLLATLSRGAQLADSFQLSAAMLSSYLAHPGWFGDQRPDLTKLSFATLYRLGGYRDWLHQTPQTKTENDLLAYLSWANSNSAPSAADAAKQLAILLNWDANDEVHAAVAYVTGDATTQARTVPQIATVMRLHRLSQQTGLAVASLVSTVSMHPGSDYAAWQQLGQTVVAASEQLAKR